VTDNAGRRRGSYFFLSYAHPSPLAGTRQSDPDPWVRRFFDDLKASVAGHAAPRTELDHGFFDQNIRTGANWKVSLTQALGTAEIFVPLYSPAYFARSWPGREWACFRGRLDLAGLEDPMRRFAPVLWIPLPKDQDPPGLPAAMAVGSGEPEYAENGLRALLRLSPYRDAYRVVVDRLARRIVELAEDAPVGPSAVPDIDETESAFGDDGSLGLAVAVAAPTAGALPAGRDAGRYGETGEDWRPFREEQELPLTAYAEDVAERLDFAAEVIDIGRRNRLVDQHGDRLGDGPGIVLIDPWFAATRDGPAVLRTVFAGLPSWVLPLIVLDTPDDGRTARLAEDVRTILVAARAIPTEAARRATDGVGSLKEFLSIMPVLIAEAERQYLRHGPVGPAARPASPRGGLRGGRPGAPDSEPRRPGEQPDA
jgi:FxsC-like protein